MPHTAEAKPTFIQSMARWIYNRYGGPRHWPTTRDAISRYSGKDLQRAVGAAVACQQTIVQYVKPDGWAIVNRDNYPFEEIAPNSIMRHVREVLEDPCGPDGEFTADVFWELMFRNCVRRGNAYALIEWGYVGRFRVPIRLRLAYPEFVSTYWQGGILHYDLTFVEHGTASPRTVHTTAQNVLHLRAWDFDGTRSPAPLDDARVAMELNMEAMETESIMLQKKVRISAMVVAPPEATNDDMKDTIKEWRDQLHSTSGKGEIPWLPPGSDVKMGNLNREDLETIAAYKMTGLEICTVMGVPGQLIPMVAKDIGEKEPLEKLLPHFHSTTIKPIVARANREIRAKMIPPNHRREWKVRAVPSPDVLSIVEQSELANLYAKGIITQNEGRRMLGLPRFDDDMADKLHYNPMGAGKDETAAPQPQPQGK